MDVTLSLSSLGSNTPNNPSVHGMSGRELMNTYNTTTDTSLKSQIANELVSRLLTKSNNPDSANGANGSGGSNASGETPQQLLAKLLSGQTLSPQEIKDLGAMLSNGNNSNGG